MENLSVMFLSLAGLLAGVLWITEAVKRIFGAKGAWAVVLSILVTAGSCYVGFYFQLGIFAGIQLWQAALYAVAVAVAANLGYQIDTLKQIVRFIFDLFDKEEPKKAAKKK